MSTKEVTIHDVLDFISSPDLSAGDRQHIIDALNYQTRAKRAEAPRRRAASVLG